MIGSAYKLTTTTTNHLYIMNEKTPPGKASKNFYLRIGN